MRFSVSLVIGFTVLLSLSGCADELVATTETPQVTQTPTATFRATRKPVGTSPSGSMPAVTFPSDLGSNLTTRKPVGTSPSGSMPAVTFPSDFGLNLTSVSAYHKHHAESKSLTDRHKGLSLSAPSQFIVHGKIYLVPFYHMAQGSGTYLYEATASGALRGGAVLLLKHFKSPGISLDKASGDAVLHTLNGTGITPLVFTDPTLSDVTRANVCIMEKAGDVPVHRYAFMDLKRIREVAIRGLKLLREYHRHGLVHGDIHYGNLVLFEKSGTSSMKLIDFDRSTPYIDSAGNMLPQKSFDPLGFNPAILSIWELEGIAPTRRDDVYRFAEMLLMLELGKGFLKVDTSRPGNEYEIYRQAKLNRQLNTSITPLIDMFASVMRLGFTDKPNYDEYIASFEKWTP